MVSTHHQAGLQHLAHLQQEASAQPVVLVHQFQQALVQVQGLERQRIRLAEQPTTWDPPEQAT